ncbi:MAG: heme exporter protein CcmD [Rhodocyclaceae bacterium]
MEWESWGAFWNMGGAAAFVWGSYAVTALLVGLELLFVSRRRRDTVRRLIRLRKVAPPARGGRIIEESEQ